MFTAVYWRYGVRHTDDYEEEHEAVNFLMYGEEYSELSSEAVLRDREVLYDKAALSGLFAALDYKPMPSTIDGVARRPPITLMEVSIVKEPPAPGWVIKKVSP